MVPEPPKFRSLTHHLADLFSGHPGQLNCRADQGFLSAFRPFCRSADFIVSLKVYHNRRSDWPHPAHHLFSQKRNIYDYNSNYKIQPVAGPWSKQQGPGLDAQGLGGYDEMRFVSGICTRSGMVNLAGASMFHVAKRARAGVQRG